MRYDPAADESRDIALDSRYEAMAEPDDFDNFEADRAADHYADQMLGGAA